MAEGRLELVDGKFQVTTITLKPTITLAASADAAKAKELLKFFDWAYKNGGQLATDLEYVPLPPAVTKLIQEAWKQLKDSDGKAIW